MEPKKEWSTFKRIKIRYLRSVRYKNKQYHVFLFKTSVDDKRRRICAGMCLNVTGKTSILINYKAYQIAKKDELKSLIKHEIIHDVLKHKNTMCSKEEYIRKHKEVYNSMSKKELVHSMLLHLRSM